MAIPNTKRASNGDHSAETSALPPKQYAEAVLNRLGNGSVDSLDSIESGHYTGTGSNPPHPASPKKAHKKASSKDLRNKRDDGQQRVVERQSYSNGERLASTAPDEDYVEGLELSKREKRSRRHSELVSGTKTKDGSTRNGIRWAPVNVPIRRRLQTLVVLTHTLTIGLCATIFFLLCAIPLTWPILVPYLLHVLFSNTATSGTLVRRSNRLRSAPFWSLFAGYFPARLHRSQELPATRKYIFGYHPHGIISHGAFVAFATEALGFSKLFPGITNTLLTLDSNFRIPLYRDYALAMGLGSVSKESCLNLLAKGGSNNEGMGRAITIVVGGARESLDAQPNTLKLVLRRRKGFVKLAIRSGADLVPVLAFGENELYDQVRPDSHPMIHKTQLIIKKLLGFTIPLFFARGVFNYDVGMMPYRRPLNIVVGKPIKVVQNRNPEDAYVDQVHREYIEELTRIWEEWRSEFAPEEANEMEIVE